MKLFFEICNISVFISVTLGFAKTDAINNRSMIQRIRNNCILFSKKWFKNSAICIKAGCIKNSIFCAEEFCNFFLKLLMEIGGSTDKSHRRHSISMIIKRCFCCLNKRWIVREAKVIICTEIQDFLSGTKFNFSSLW